MNSWEKIYAERKMTAAEAVKKVKSGERIVVGHAAGATDVLLQALVDDCQHLKDVEVVHMMTLGVAPEVDPKAEGHIRLNATFAGGNTRKAITEKRADFTPVFFYELPELLKQGKPLQADVAFIQVSKPNPDGYCSFGISCDYTKPAAELAHTVIAEVNEQMPYIAGGDNLIHVSKIDAIVEINNPVFTLPEAQLTDIDKAIGGYCSELVKDGSTLQLGIGSIPDAVLLSLTGKKDLGIHTEMFSDGVVELVKKGIVNGSKKTLHKGKLVATFLMGTQKLYDFAAECPDVEMYSVDYVNDPRVIMKNDNMVSINSCIEVDMMGQVNSETIGLKQFSGTGGQVDYVRGTAMAKNGLSIMAMPSTAAKGKVSRIVPFLGEGAAVTTGRTDVNYVVTEYGIASLKGATLKQRAERLINIAHPDFRAMLKEEYNKRFK